MGTVSGSFLRDHAIELVEGRAEAVTGESAVRGHFETLDILGLPPRSTKLPMLRRKPRGR
jgi:hypothetical protein